MASLGLSYLHDSDSDDPDIIPEWSAVRLARALVAEVVVVLLLLLPLLLAGVELGAEEKAETGGVGMDEAKSKSRSRSRRRIQINAEISE
jgi:hypothetical protein